MLFNVCTCIMLRVHYNTVIKIVFLYFVRLPLQPPPLSNSFDDHKDLSLAPSDVYAAYCNPAQLTPLSSSSCFLSSAQWCRARLLRILPDHAADGSRLVVLLAVDFGFMMTLPESQLAPLPPECRGIPPQVWTDRCMWKNIVQWIYMYHKCVFIVNKTALL